MDGPENPKLLELREKTDQQLLVLIGRRLDFAFSRAIPSSEAERAYRDACILLPLVRGNAADRKRLASRTRRLGRLLSDAAVPKVAYAGCSQIPA
jgi:hypothetical protein